MNINDIEIRSARIGDIDDILGIECSSFVDSICETRDVFLERIKTFEEGFIVAQYKGKVVGYLCTEIWNYNENINKDSFILGHSIKDSHKANGDELYISSFAILPNVRKYGIGKMLFNYVTDNVNKLVKDPKSILLLVAENWSSARRIYINKGFEEVIILKDFFDYENIKPFKADGIVMRKLL